MFMDIEYLKDKSEENFNTAVWAEKKRYFNVAISRYYYCLLQKIIYISKKNGFYSEPPNGNGSHEYTINRFISKMGNKLSAKEKVTITQLKKLKRQRVDADYKETKIESNEFNLVFKYNFQNINEIVNKFL